MSLRKSKDKGFKKEVTILKLREDQFAGFFFERLACTSQTIQGVKRLLGRMLHVHGEEVRCIESMYPNYPEDKEVYSEDILRFMEDCPYKPLIAHPKGRLHHSSVM